MKNEILCKNCGSENPFYGFICKSCKGYLRERIVNVDLWHAFNLLIESPVKAFLLIIKAEHKNFIFFITFFAAIKLLIDAVFITQFRFGETDFFASLLIKFLIVFGGFLAIISIFSLIYKYLNISLGLYTRFKDNFAILIYSFVPFVFALFILFLIEISLFGGYLFSVNPSPFVIKETLAYVLLVVEFLIILWSIFLSVTALYAQTKNIPYSITLAAIFNGAFYAALYFAAVPIIKI